MRAVYRIDDKCVIITDKGIKKPCADCTWLVGGYVVYGLFDGPGLACENHVAEGGEAFGGPYLGHLSGDAVVVCGGFDVADHAECEWERLTVHHGKLLVEEVRLSVGVVYKHVVDGVAVLADCHGFEEEAVAYEALVLVFAEYHLFAVAQQYCAVGAYLAVGDGVVDSVVEDHAVLEDLDYGSAFMAGGSGEDVLRCGQLDINAAGEEVAACAEHQLCRNEGVFHSSVRARLRHETACARRGVLAFGEAVDLVVEEHDVDVDVSAYGVDEVVAADGEAVAVARDLPYGHLRIGHFVACGYCGGASVDCVEAVCVHVVGQARAAADTRYHGSLVRGYSQRGHGLVESVEYGVVAAAGAPAYRLFAFIVGCCILCIHLVANYELWIMNSLGWGL